MKKPRKNVLIYADGRVEEIAQDLVGMRFLKTEIDDAGNWWTRVFQTDMAYSGPEDQQVSEGGPDVYTLVAVERSFTMTRTAEEVAKATAERRARTMNAALWGIRNYPGDDE